VISGVHKSFFSELKKRNVAKVSLAYLALGWVVIEVTATVMPVLNLPGWLPSRVVWIGIIGFSFVAVFSWIYELTPDGLKRKSEPGQSSSGVQRLNPLGATQRCDKRAWIELRVDSEGQ
jgi:hypothetical protein